MQQTGCVLDTSILYIVADSLFVEFPEDCRKVNRVNPRIFGERFARDVLGNSSSSRSITRGGPSAPCSISPRFRVRLPIISSVMPSAISGDDVSLETISTAKPRSQPRQLAVSRRDVIGNSFAFSPAVGKRALYLDKEKPRARSLDPITMRKLGRSPENGLRRIDYGFRAEYLGIVPVHDQRKKAKLMRMLGRIAMLL